MEEWFDDEEVNDLLTKLMDRLCTLERMDSEVYSSTLILIPEDKRRSVLWCTDGKPFPPEDLTALDIEIAVKLALLKRGLDARRSNKGGNHGNKTV